jgi:beta-glucosidase
MELRGFERVSLAPGETRTVSFVLGFDDFAYLDRKLKPVLEPGHFDLMIGSSSADIRLRGSVKL